MSNGWTSANPPRVTFNFIPLLSTWHATVTTLADLPTLDLSLFRNNEFGLFDLDFYGDAIGSPSPMVTFPGGSVSAQQFLTVAFRPETLTRVPEPSTLVLAGCGVLVLLFVLLRQLHPRLVALLLFWRKKFRPATPDLVGRRMRVVHIGRLLAGALSVLGATGTTSTVSAAPISVPSDLSPGDQYRLVFVTDAYTDAEYPDISDYNSFVSGLANAVPELAGLGTTWSVIGSAWDDAAIDDARYNTGTNPAVSTGVPIYRLDDTRVADDNVDLWDGSLQAPIATNEYGALADPYFDHYVWTGTYADGTNADFYGRLGDSATGTVIYGRSNATGAGWVNESYAVFTTELYLYGMSDVLTVVPEPSSLALAAYGAIGMLLLAASRWRHRAGHQLALVVCGAITSFFVARRRRRSLNAAACLMSSSTDRTRMCAYGWRLVRIMVLFACYMQRQTHRPSSLELMQEAQVRLISILTRAQSLFPITAK